MPAYEGPHTVLEVVNAVTYVLGETNSTSTFTSHVLKLKHIWTLTEQIRTQMLSA